MAEAVIRRVRPEDAPALAALWHRVFEDPEELSRDFLAHLSALGGGVCAEEDGKLLGAAYAVTDYSILLPDRNLGRFAAGIAPCFVAPLDHIYPLCSAGSEIGRAHV